MAAHSSLNFLCPSIKASKHLLFIDFCNMTKFLKTFFTAFHACFMYAYIQSLLREKMQPHCTETDTHTGEDSNQCQASTVKSAGFIWQTQAPPSLSHLHLTWDLKIRSVTMTSHSQNALQLSKHNATLPLPFLINWLFLPPLWLTGLISNQHKTVSGKWIIAALFVFLREGLRWALCSHGNTKLQPRWTVHWVLSWK